MASLPISSIDSRRAYFRSSETAKACLWLFSSRLSSRLGPSAGSRQSRCSRAAAALQGGVVAAAENLVQVEAQQPVVRPLAALDQQDAAEREHQHPARRVVLAEDAAGDDLVPGLAQQRLGRGRPAVELQGVRLELERVLALRLGVVGPEGEQGGGAGPAARGAEDGHLVAGVEGMVGGRPRVAEGGEEPPEPLALQGQPPSAAALAVEVAAEPHVAAGQRPQRRVRRLSAPGLGRLAPAFHGGADVAAEDLRQIVVAVELVLVVDAGERGGGGGHGSTQMQVSVSSVAVNRTAPVLRAATLRGAFPR